MTTDPHVHVPEAPKPHDHSLAALHARLDRLSADVAYLAERQRALDELLADAVPIAKGMMASASSELEAYEARGYFALARESLGIVRRVAEAFSPDDVRKLGEATVGILETVRELTQPEVLEVASEAAGVLQHADEAAPIGLVGMVRATGDHDVQKGMSVMVEVMRHVGRAATAVRDKRAASPMGQKKARLAAALGRRRPPSPPPAPDQAIPLTRPKSAAAGPVASPASAAPAIATAAPSAILDGARFGADGHLVDPADWTRGLGEKLAALHAIEPTDAHWALIEAARKDFAETSAAPNIRRLTQIGGLSTKDVYTLFPKAPARTLAKIAGLPKPAGCL